MMRFNNNYNTGIANYFKFFCCFIVLFIISSHAVAKDRYLAEDEDVFELSLQELLQITVTSVSKKSQRLADAATAIYVISNDDIKRSGVTSIPEALRLAPGVNVARISSHKWAISSRGFNGSFANKLLVLIDGRAVYTTSFSGVYWDTQDVMLEDIDRIEVIRGPGATVWGANAVNGVINIISKNAKQTQGGLLVAGGGTEEKGFASLRYGAELNENSHARFYIKGGARDEFKNKQGGGAEDNWENFQGGFRLDSKLSKHDDVTISGNIYHVDENQIIISPQLTAPYSNSTDVEAENSGWNVLSRLEHEFSNRANYSVQFYYDHYQRSGLGDVLPKVRNNVFDIEFQNNLNLDESLKISWGLGYRYMQDVFIKAKYSDISPNSRNDQLFSAFIQNEVAVLKDVLFLTLGAKFEHNDYTGFEIQPTARLMWNVSDRQRLWGAVSRAVRTPSRGEHGVSVLVQVDPTTGVGVTMEGDENFQAEELIAYELGYRYKFTNSASIDIAMFYHDYDHLVGTRVGDFDVSTGTVSTYFDNSSEAETYGIETAVKWAMMDWWRWDINYSLLKTQLHTSSAHQQSISPNHQFSIRSSISPIKNINLDLWFRYVGENQGINAQASEEIIIDDYITLDIRMAWQVNESLELSMTGQNLLDGQHLEYIQESYTEQTEVPRGFYGKLEWHF